MLLIETRFLSTEHANTPWWSTFSSFSYKSSRDSVIQCVFELFQIERITRVISFVNSITMISSTLIIFQCSYAGQKGSPAIFQRSRIAASARPSFSTPSTGYYRRSRRCVPHFSQWNWCRHNACDARHDAQINAMFDPRKRCSAGRVLSRTLYRCWAMYAAGICCCSARFCYTMNC